MRFLHACGSPEHQLARRDFLGLLSSGAIVGGLGSLARPAAASALAKADKRILVINMEGGLSQLESWDPKPGTSTGGPFRAIPTTVPGLHICELLPKSATQMHRLAVVRGVNTAEDDHGKGRYMMLTGRRQTPVADFPVLGAVAAKALTANDSPLPGHIQIVPGGGGGRSADSAYLGPKYSSIHLGNGAPPQNTERPGNLAPEMAQARNEFRRRANERFLQRRRSAHTDAYTYSYEQALQLMERREIFDVSKEPTKEQEKYGATAFGRHCLLARRLLEKGITFVQVSHSNYDTHNENFDFHLEQLGEFDGVFATLIDDLAQRGLLQHTLVVVLSEFGRTPGINLYCGRDHWSKAWSVVAGGVGIRPGSVVGKTNANGTEVIERQVDHAQLFHTYLQAVGLDSTSAFEIGGREMLLADPAAAPIKELLA